MTRLVHRRIDVQSWTEEEPFHFLDGTIEYTVSEVIDRWSEMGNWWEGEGARKILRVATEQQSVFDLEFVSPSWYIYRIWD